MKGAVFVIIGILLFCSLAEAEDFVLSGYTEVGKRSTAEDYEEEDNDDDYTYRNYHFKLKQEVSDRLSYDISSFIYDKDYKSNNALDNISRIFNSKWSYYPRKLEEESLRLTLKLKYKEKRYNNSPANEYNQVMFSPALTFKQEDLYTIDLAGGIDNFDYLSAGEKDQLKFFGKIGAKRYFLEKKLLLTSSYKLETTKQEKENRKRTKNNLSGGFDYKFEWPWVHHLTARGKWGQRDTKDDEDRDEDFDYEYWQYYAKTTHKIGKRLKTDLKYQYFKKDYLTADLDHCGFYIKNSWNYKIFDDKKNKISLIFLTQHKDVKYKIRSGNDYKKETAEIKTTYQRKKNWRASASWQGNFYNYSDASNDKKRYYVVLSGEKLFLGGDLALLLDLKYRYTDYDQKGDSETQAVRMAFKYKF